MKKLLFLILFVAGTIYAQPPINQLVTDITVCEYPYDELATFDLTTNNSNILGSLNPLNYNFNFFNHIAT